MKFSIGELVVEKGCVKAHTSYSVQKVVGFLNEAVLLQHYGTFFDGDLDPSDPSDYEPGTRGWRQDIERYQEDQLWTLVESAQELYRLEEVKNKLDDEFEVVRDQLKAKLDQAALLVQEAAVLATAHDREFCNLKEECMPLYRALYKGGWSHSHMSC